MELGGTKEREKKDLQPLKTLIYPSKTRIAGFSCEIVLRIA